ncbi:MAG: DNA (cytosine-5-)-methyltransferase [Proteobacteria bacterium]|jgi:DNA (cytosine-5)-methyltransferase 1|nr:DNA (cytosine-5-)-methyltransferase [Pseudomonadota bacterium]
MTYYLGELFCGPGGVAKGAEQARVDKRRTRPIVRHRWAVDYHPDTCNTFRENILNGSEASVLTCDVRQLDVARDLLPLGNIDIFAYGFPCNDFSLVGEHKGIAGDFGPLYSYGLPVLETFRPKAFVAENVGGIQSANEGKAFTKILSDLEDCGYRLTPHLYRFERYGVPQTRHRVIVVGIRNDLDLEFRVPAETHPYEYVSCRSAIENPPIGTDVTNQERTKQSQNVILRLKNIKPGENAWTANLPEDLKLNVKGAKLSQIYKRLDPDQPAYTITGSGGGGTHVYHWKEPRALTNRERARLQTFPDDFEFIGSKESVRRQIGMAVPPLGAKIIFEALIKTLEKKPYEHIKANLMDRYKQPQEELFV